MADLTEYDGFIAPAEKSHELELKERAIQDRASGGELFEPDIPRETWQEFCAAAEKEEAGGRLSEGEKKLLGRADVLRDEQTEALLQKRDELAREVRPQCTDPNHEAEADEVEKLVNEAFGIEDWGSIDTSIGKGV